MNATASYSLLDQMIISVDDTLRVLWGLVDAARPNPAHTLKESKLTQAEKQHSARLMRVNHSGEVCAQALYEGQRLWAFESKTRALLTQAAKEEKDHLAWCAERLWELGSHPSYLNIFWYSQAYLIGLGIGWLGDRWSLAFIEETEVQVETHLRGHLRRLSPSDAKSRAILQRMIMDEKTHGQAAKRLSSQKRLPCWVPKMMKITARVMTWAAYYF